MGKKSGYNRMDIKLKRGKVVTCSLKKELRNSRPVAIVQKAEDVLLNEAFFTVNAPTFEKFQALLDKSLPANDKLRQLLKTKAPWEKKS